MPQIGPPSIVGINNIISNPAAALPLDTNKYALVQAAGSRKLEKVRVADIGGGGLAGSGTVNRVGKFSGATTVGNSNISDDGTTVAITGNETVSGTLGVTGAATLSSTVHAVGKITADGNVAIGGYLNESLAAGLAAVGTNLGSALALTHQINIIATAASSAVGVALPPAATVGVNGWVDVYNDGPSNSFHVYGAGGDTIDGTAGATGVALTNGFWSRFIVTAAGTYISFRSPVTRSA